MMPDGEGFSCPLTHHSGSAAVHVASSRHSADRSCGGEGCTRPTTRRHGWREAASAAAGLSLVVIVACLAAAPERIRSYGADVLAAAGGKGGLRARGAATAGRLEALADAEAHDILSTATFAKNPQTDGVLAASLLKIQASTWAEQEAHDLAASLASAIRKTDHASAHPNDYRRDLTDTLHNTGLARVEARRTAAVKAARQEEGNRKLHLFDASAKQPEMESRDPHLFDTSVKQPGIESRDPHLFDTSVKQPGIENRDPHLFDTSSKQYEVEGSNLHIFDTSSKQPEAEGLRTFQDTPEQAFYEHHKQMFKAGHEPMVAARNAPLQHPIHHQPKVHQRQNQVEQVVHQPSPPLIQHTQPPQNVVPASVVAIFKEQEAKDAANALQVEAARQPQPTGHAGQSASDLTWPAVVRPRSYVADTQAQQHAATDSPAAVTQVGSQKVHENAGVQHGDTFSTATWRRQGAQGLAWPHALVRAAGASVQQRHVRAQAKSFSANHHLSSQPKKKQSVREQLKRARSTLDTQARAREKPAGGNDKLINYHKHPSSASEGQVERAREALFKQVGRSSVLLAKPNQHALSQMGAKLAVVRQAQKWSREPPVMIVAPDVHAEAAAPARKAVHGDVPTVLIVPPDVPATAAALTHKAAHVAAPKQSLGPHSLDEPSVTIVAPGGHASTAPPPPNPVPVLFGNPKKGAAPLVVIVAPGEVRGGDEVTSHDQVASPPQVVPAPNGQISITPPTPVASGGENTGEEGDEMRESDETFAGPLHHVPHVSSAQAVTRVVASASAAADERSADGNDNEGDSNWRGNLEGQVVRAGATCAQNPAKVGGEGPRQCAVWAQPAWGHMKKLPVGSSPQVANGCIQYVCRSVRAEPQKFLDQRLGLLIESLTNHCLDGASYLSLQFNKIWKYSVRGLYNMWGQELPDGFETGDGHLDLKFAKGLKLVEVDDSAHRVDPETIPPGTIMDSMVYGCMYPFMNCKNQLYMARHLCQDDGYWIRGIHDFNCTGGFIASSTGDATKWKYVDHFALSAILLLGLVVLGIFARSYAISRNREMDRRFWWMHHITNKDDDDAQGQEIVQITL